MSTAWSDFLQEIEDAKGSLGFADAEDCFYRGHTHDHFTLTPSLYRIPDLDADDYWQLESDLFFEFQARAHQLHGRGMSDWDVLFHMRHHGVSTRLLDWTEVLGVALYFAIQDFDPNAPTQPCIWLLNPWKLNETSWKDRDLVAPQYLGWDPDSEEYDDYGELLAMIDGMGWDLPVAIYPQQTNPRLAAQKGIFTIQGDRIGPLEKLFPKCVRKVLIPPAVVPTAAELLKLVGVDPYLLFPDLDGLARALSDKYSLAGKAEARVSGRGGNTEQRASSCPRKRATPKKRSKFRMEKKKPRSRR